MFAGVLVSERIFNFCVFPKRSRDLCDSSLFSCRGHDQMIQRPFLFLFTLVAATGELVAIFSQNFFVLESRW